MWYLIDIGPCYETAVKVETNMVRYPYSNSDRVHIGFTNACLLQNPRTILMFQRHKFLFSAREQRSLKSLKSGPYFNCSPSFSPLSAPRPMAASSSPTSYYPSFHVHPTSQSPLPLQSSPPSSNPHSSSPCPRASYFPYSYLALVPLSLAKQGAADTGACSDSFWLRLQSVPWPAFHGTCRAQHFESIRVRFVSVARL